VRCHWHARKHSPSATQGFGDVTFIVHHFILTEITTIFQWLWMLKAFLAVRHVFTPVEQLYVPYTTVGLAQESSGQRDIVMAVEPSVEQSDEVG
jgi:hypothetical protein